jgi:hypothetical protein
MTGIDTSDDAVEWQARHFDHLAALYKSEANKDDATRWDQAAALLRQLAKDKAEAEARVKELEEALKPFAEAYRQSEQFYFSDPIAHPDDYLYRQAAELLSELENSK